MVKVLFLSIVLTSAIFASAKSVARGFVDHETYVQNRDLINALFVSDSRYKTNGELDSLKILEKLKANNLLFLENPSGDVVLNFDTKGSPILAKRLISDVLEELGHNNFLTKRISKDEDLLSWSINIKSNLIPDPLELALKLHQYFVNIEQINRSGKGYWSYKLDLSKAFLKANRPLKNETTKLNKPNKAYLFMVENVSEVVIEAHSADNWHPQIIFFDRFLHPIDEIRNDKNIKTITIAIPQNAFYMEVEDRFVLDNIKRGLSFTFQ